MEKRRGRLRGEKKGKLLKSQGYVTIEREIPISSVDQAQVINDFYELSLQLSLQIFNLFLL